MKIARGLFSALLVLVFLSPASAGEKSYPEKDPVLNYAAPAGWKIEVDTKDGTISINAPDGRISINFGSIPREATMELFEKMLPAMIKVITEATLVDKPKAQTTDGLASFTSTYAGKIEGKPALCTFFLFKGGKDRSVLGNIIVSDPETLSKEDSASLAEFMKSMKGAAK